MDQPRKDDEDSVETDENLASCLQWKSSGLDHKKTALDIYETISIFASACQHGFIIKVCKMVKSGELAKYPLTITDALINLYGQDIGVGGFGLEDLETMEHVFSASNAVAHTMHYATQALNLHFQQWDDDKYQELSKFLMNNYVQAQGLIDEYTDAVASLSSSLGLAENNFECWIDEEHQFLMDLKKELSDHVLACSYIQALVDVDNAHQKWERTSDAFKHMSSSDKINYAELTDE
ncbi:hypothetical protein EDD22DRAFT_954188 [Suillus occidentalis]|nr:hypothetical protein EDD22DRAFT_954188 [Suillus occidentalis]